MFFFFKQKTAYEMRISDWSSDVCSSDLVSLDAATKVNVRMKEAGRQVELLAGRAKFDVAKDPQRPFTVAAGDKLVVAVGTSFSVELIDGQVRVILYEGQVEVRDRNSAVKADRKSTRLNSSH